MKNSASDGIERSATPGFWRRMAAILYDSLLVIAVLILAMTLVVVTMASVQGWDQFDPSELRHNPLYIAFLLSLPLLFFVGFWTRGGQTLGMRSWRIRVVTPEGNPIGITAALLRFIAALLSWAILGLGFFWVLVDRSGLAWHDRLSKTRLVIVAKSCGKR